MAKRILCLLKSRGPLADEGAPLEDPLLRDEPLLAGCAVASIGHRIEAEDVESVPGNAVPGVLHDAWTSPGPVDTQRPGFEAASNASGLTPPRWLWRRVREVAAFMTPRARTAELDSSR